MNHILLELDELLRVDDKVVVAVSGGPDSVCLLHLLNDLKKKKDFCIIVAHVNHKLRRESEEEAKFVQWLCKQMHIVYEYMEIEEYEHDNLESVARQKRYAFFEQLVQKYHASYVMTAHHGDDLIETILMRMVRGSSLKGYSGFKKIVVNKNYKIVRPLIEVSKKDILEYLDKKNIKYYIDQSNYSLRYTRNRYRHNVLPFLKEENSQVHLKFLKFSQELEEANQFIDNYIKELVEHIKDKNGLKIAELEKLDDFLLKRVIEYELSLVYTNDLFLICDKHRDALIRLIKLEQRNGQVHLPNHYIALKNYHFFKIVHNKEKKNYKLLIDQDINVFGGKIKILHSSQEKSNYVIRLNSKELKLPLWVRNRDKGDKMVVKNLGGSKKIKDIFIDEKIPKEERDDYPVVIDSENTILWLPGVKKSKFDVETDGIYDIILSYEEE